MIFKEKIRVKGKLVTRDAVRIGNVTFIVSAGFPKTATVTREWQDDVTNPEAIIHTFKAARARVDLLRFWQRIPESEAKYPYYREWR